jgi:hypothetical protein
LDTEDNSVIFTPPSILKDTLTGCDILQRSGGGGGCRSGGCIGADGEAVSPQDNNGTLNQSGSSAAGGGTSAGSGSSQSPPKSKVRSRFQITASVTSYK